MKLNAVGVTAKDVKKTVEFYTILGFKFPEVKENGHIETVPEEGSPKLMIDDVETIKDVLCENPKPSNHSGFAVQYDSPEEVNEIVKQVTAAGFKVVKEPWDAFWGQRYAIVEDPDGYKTDLYAQL